MFRKQVNMTCTCFHSAHHMFLIWAVIRCTIRFASLFATAPQPSASSATAVAPSASEANESAHNTSGKLERQVTILSQVNGRSLPVVRAFLSMYSLPAPPIFVLNAHFCLPHFSDRENLFYMVNMLCSYYLPFKTLCP